MDLHPLLCASIFILIFPLCSAFLPLPPKIQSSKSCDLEDSPPNATDSLINKPDQRLNCYDRTDLVFFPEDTEAVSFNYANCYREGRRFWIRFEREQGLEQVNYWYTTDYKKPEGAHAPSLQLPVFYSSDRCTFALMSTKELSDFCFEQNIDWRKEWGPRERPYTDEEVFGLKATDVFLNDGFFGAMYCVKRGDQAGHICKLYCCYPFARF